MASEHSRIVNTFNKGTLVDTGFLISLVNPARPSHDAARAYFEFAVHSGIPIYLPTLVMAEFGVRQPVTDLPMHNFIVAPFNADDAQLSAKMMGLNERAPSDSREGTKIDLAILAQAERLGLPSVLSEDRDTIYKYCNAHRDGGLLRCHVLLMRDGFVGGRVLNPSINELSLTPKNLSPSS